MKTRKLRLLSFVLAVAMMFAIAPVSAFAADGITDENGRKITNITIDGNGQPIIQINETKGENGKVTTTVESPKNVVCNVNPENGFRTYVYKDPNNNNAEGWAIPETRGLIAIRPGYSYEGAGTQVVSSTMTIAGNLNGGIYSGSVSAESRANGAVANVGTITDGIFQVPTKANGGEIRGGLFLNSVSKSSTATSKIVGGVFARDPGSTEEAKHKLKATGCRIYTESAYNKYNNIADNTRVYIENTTAYPEAYVVGNQKIVLTINNPTFDHWEVKANGTVVKVDANSSAVGGSTTYTDTSDGNDNHVLKFTMPADDVEITPVAPPVEFHIGANGLPEYNGETYMGNLALDGWHLSENTGSAYPYVLTVKQGTTVDFEGHTANWAFANYGTIKNGILPGNIVNRQNTDGTYGRVENVAFKMNVSFGDQNPDITWVTLKNATACDVFPDIVGVIGKQTITIKPSISADLFKGWVVGGDISDELAEQIEKQKNNDTLVLELDGEQKDRIAVAAKTEGETFRVNMLDGKATVDDTAVTAVVPGQTVTLSIDDSEIPAGMSFDHWVVNPADVELEGGFDAASRTTSFTMPAEELTIYASLRTDSGNDGTDAMTVVAGVAVGAGVAALTYHIGTELYAEQVLGKGVAIPRTREEVALKAWELAGKPAVELNGEPLSETAQAEKWAVESGLMQNVDGSFNGSKKMSKLKALRTLDAAKKLG